MKRLLALLLCVGVALPALAVQKPGQPPRFISTWAAVRDAAPGEHHTVASLKSFFDTQSVSIGTATIYR